MGNSHHHQTQAEATPATPATPATATEGGDAPATAIPGFSFEYKRTFRVGLPPSGPPETSELYVLSGTRLTLHHAVLNKDPTSKLQVKERNYEHKLTQRELTELLEMFKKLGLPDKQLDFRGNVDSSVCFGKVKIIGSIANTNFAILANFMATGFRGADAPMVRALMERITNFFPEAQQDGPRAELDP